MSDHFDDIHGGKYLHAFSSEFDKIEEHFIGNMDSQCQYCDSINLKCEAVANEFTACCNKGSILLPSLLKLPQAIIRLYNGVAFRNDSILQS